MGFISAKAVRRYFSLCATDPITGCVNWTGTVDSDGYGRFKTGGKTYRAHRMALGLFGSSLQALHRCDNRRCVNGEHLFVGTNTDNMQDKARKGRAAQKLTMDKANAIRRLAGSSLSHADIARLFGVCRPLVSEIVAGKKWVQS